MGLDHSLVGVPSEPPLHVDPKFAARGTVVIDRGRLQVRETGT